MENDRGFRWTGTDIWRLEIGKHGEYVAMTTVHCVEKAVAKSRWKSTSETCK